MIINGIHSKQFRFKLGKPPFKENPNDPVLLAKLADAEKYALLPILMEDGTLVKPGELHLYRQKNCLTAPRKTARILTRRKSKSSSKTT